ncbi:unnamed protein product [Arabidopsis lyrata]|uniref:Predicted protein n=1 Tax=Arabidopsis lyrata subsp. lyrata TaxID=81972 RepID=D7M0R0_ARALL|nr:UPF0725 protein At3g25080 isoform X2 [Arabidopsis lyrata subsp. lyrata]EFH50292.1 predicted protein [Arabidopsis lyrata subsp. lyrata]CAH8271805.1 unnamed protein product [Arabidopsis lyrata]|eukprot:XP_002874033.1 UPF0725 protein At3g25080 isoform X2 [Arabidopsis lyrata subsp. lyrata]
MRRSPLGCGGAYDLKASTHGYMVQVCNQRFPCPALVFFYAKMGLHRYNFVQGTKFELSRVKQYVMSTGSAASSYYITLDAIDPAGALVTFQTKVSEHSFGKFILDCHIAKVRGETRDGKGFLMIDHSFPKCPLENPFETYYLVKESELQENAWVLLYLQLAVATTHRYREAKDFGLPNLEILDVAIDDEQGLYAKNAVFYIRYKDYLYKSNLAHDLDRIAIVRRCFDKATGCFSLVGQNLSSHVLIPNTPKITYEDTTGCSTFNGHILSPEPSTLVVTSEDHEAANHLAILSIDEAAAGDSMELDSSLCTT